MFPHISGAPVLSPSSKHPTSSHLPFPVRGAPPLSASSENPALQGWLLAACFHTHHGCHMDASCLHLGARTLTFTLALALALTFTPVATRTHPQEKCTPHTHAHTHTHTRSHTYTLSRRQGHAHIRTNCLNKGRRTQNYENGNGCTLARVHQARASTCIHADARRQRLRAAKICTRSMRAHLLQASTPKMGRAGACGPACGPGSHAVHRQAHRKHKHKRHTKANTPMPMRSMRACQATGL